MSHNLTPDHLAQISKLAADAAFAAGELLQRYAMEIDSLDVQKKSTCHDLVSQADMDAEKLIQERLFSTSILDSEVGFLGEETYNKEPLDMQYYWVVDPLDGTSNYLSGLPIWSVSIAFCESNLNPLAGVIYAPELNRTYSATVESRAMLNNRPVSVRQCPPGNDMYGAMLATGFPYDTCREESHDSLMSFVKMQSNFHKIRRLGSAAIDMALVAEGIYDGLWEGGLKPWDTAAGTIIIRQAGGLIEQYSGEPYLPTAPSLIAASTSEMLSLMRSILTAS